MKIDKPTIASELIIEATEMKGKRPTQLNFEELIDVIESVVKKLTTPVVVKSFVCEFCKDKGVYLVTYPDRYGWVKCHCKTN